MFSSSGIRRFPPLPRCGSARAARACCQPLAAFARRIGSCQTRSWCPRGQLRVNGRDDRVGLGREEAEEFMIGPRLARSSDRARRARASIKLRPGLTVGCPGRFGGLPLRAALLHDAFGVGDRRFAKRDSERQRDRNQGPHSCPCQSKKPGFRMRPQNHKRHKTPLLWLCDSHTHHKGAGGPCVCGLWPMVWV